ncbi:MAG: DUF6544 family protein [Actinomycetota bacterium]
MRDVGERVIDLIETGVPVGFERYAAAAFGDELPTFGTVAFRGTARIRPGGRGPWLPATAATYHRLGNAFAGEFALAPFRRAILRGTDGYLEGHGASTIAGRPVPVSPELDRSARMFMWMEAALFPQTWTVPGVQLEQVDDLTLRILVPPDAAAITWRIDPDSGLPWRIEAIRDKEAGGRPVRQRIDLSGWRSFGDIRCWWSARVTWADEARAWFDWTLDEVEQGAGVDAVFERVAAAARGERKRRPAFRSWGATVEETTRALPGDDLAPEPWLQSTRAITIDAPPELVWPWLVQIGDRRAGWYSYDWVERAFGCRYVDGHSSTRVVPELQRLRVGDPVWFAPRVSIPVTALDPERHLVIGESWAFVLEPLPDGRTRFLVRTRGGWMHEWLSGHPALRRVGDAIDHVAGEPLHFAMERKMMLGIKERAERLAEGTA